MEIFHRRTTFGGGFNAITAKVLFSGFRTGLAFESVNVSYNQQLVRIFDLDGNAGNTYLVAGHAMGRANISRTIGPRALSDAFYTRYGDVCRAAENVLAIAADVGCDSNSAANRQFSGSVDLRLNGVVIDGITIGLNAQDPIIRQSMSLTFISLEHQERTGAQAQANENITQAA